MPEKDIDPGRLKPALADYVFDHARSFDYMAPHMQAISRAFQSMVESRARA